MTSDGWLRAEPLERAPAVGRDEHAVALALEVVADGVRERLLVLDDEDAGGLRRRRRVTPPG